MTRTPRSRRGVRRPRLTINHAILADLKQARGALSFERVTDEIRALDAPGMPLRLYLDSWVRPFLDAAISMIEATE